MLLTENIFVRITSNMCKYYKEKGYSFKCNEIILVDIKDLPLKSNMRVNVKCDKCEKEYELSYCDYNKQLFNGNIYCQKCKYEKTRITNISKYGCENVFQNDDIREKQKQSVLKKYGCENVFQNECIKEKIKETFLKKYGVPHPMKNKIIANKCFKKSALTLLKNHSQNCSSQQSYIAKLLNCNTNHLIDFYWVDMLISDKIYLEYNGSGHRLSVKYKKETLLDFENREKKRINYLYNKGFQGIILESEDDCLPKDAVIKNIVNIGVIFLNNNKSVKTIVFDITNNTIYIENTNIDYDYKEDLSIINNKIVTTKEDDTHKGEDIV